MPPRPKEISAAKIPSLSEIAAHYFKGNFEALPDQAIIDLKNMTKEDFTALLEIARYRMDGHKILKQEPELVDLQSLRTIMNSGQFKEVLSKLSENHSDDPEVLLEKGRAHVFLGEYQRALDTLLPLIMNSGTQTLSRGVAAQMVGHAFLEKGDLEQAADFLDLALECARRTGNSVGRVAALFFLSKLNGFRRTPDEGFLQLDEALDLITGEVGGLRWLLGYYRHAGYLEFIAGQKKAQPKMVVAALMAGALNDSHFETKSLLELSIMETKFGRAESSILAESALMNKITTQVEKGNDELACWHEAATCGHVPGNSSQSLQFFLAKPVITRDSQPDVPLKILIESTPWIFDSDKGLLIDLKSGGLSKLPLTSPHSRILRELAAEPEGMDIPDFIEKIWNVKWSAERHKSLLSVTLLRFNKLIESLKIERSSNRVRLSVMGYVL